jgi:hypothetical protein
MATRGPGAGCRRSIDGQEVRGWVGATIKPVHEQQEVDGAVDDQIAACCGGCSGRDHAGDEEEHMEDVVQYRHLEQSKRDSLGVV